MTEGFEEKCLPIESLECYFMFSLIWCIGVTIDDDGRPDFNVFMKNFLNSGVDCLEDFKTVQTALMLTFLWWWQQWRRWIWRWRWIRRSSTFSSWSKWTSPRSTIKTTKRSTKCNCIRYWSFLWRYPNLKLHVTQIIHVIQYQIFLLASTRNK